MLKFIPTFFFMLLILAPRAHAQYVDFIYGAKFCRGFLGKMTPEAHTVYLFSAGHCVSGVKTSADPNRVVIRQDLNPVKEFRIYQPALPDQKIMIHGTQILLATYQTADFAILKITEDSEALQKLGTKPFLIGNTPVPLLTPVQVFNNKTQEKNRCVVEHYPFALTFETSIWRWSTRLSAECALAPGWSGAPVLDEATQTVRGLIGGGNDRGDCSDYCEVAADGKGLALKGRVYFTRLDFLSRCTDSKGEIIPENCHF